MGNIYQTTVEIIFLINLFKNAENFNLTIKTRFYIEVAVYLVYFFLSGLVLILKRRYFDYLEEGGCVYISSEGKYVMQDICPCASLYPNDPYAKVWSILFFHLKSISLKISYFKIISFGFFVKYYFGCSHSAMFYL